jgi:hypothetical protein
MKKCKSCQTEIDDKAKKCPNCKSDQRNWFIRHKILSAIFVLILLGVVGGALGGGSSKNSSSNSSNGTSNSGSSEKTYRFNERADKQAKDVEVTQGESGTVDGRKLTVVSIERKTSLGEYQQAPSGKIYVVANVTIENVSDRTQTYNVFDFRLQTVSGQVIDPYIGGNNDLNSGDLVKGGKVSGNVTFEAPVETASQYIIYKPNSAISDRVIVEAKQ